MVKTKRIRENKNKTFKNNAAKKYSIKPGPREKTSRSEALEKLNNGVFGLNWKEKARAFNFDLEHVVANVMHGHMPFKHHSHMKERKPEHKFRL